MNEKKIGLVLSGGGTRGVAQIGAIKALQEEGIEATLVSGSSAGSVVGALYSAGYSPEKMLNFFKEMPLFQMSRFAFGKPGFIDTDKFYDDFRQWFPEDSFEALEKELFVSTVEMLDGDLVVFNKGPLIRRLLASSAFPGLFSPVATDGSLYADGGIMDNFPIQPLRTRADHIIGVYVSPLERIDQDDLKYSVNVLERAIRINYSRRSISKFDACDLLIKPSQLNSFGLLDVRKMDMIYAIGYDEAKRVIQDLREKRKLFI